MRLLRTLAEAVLTVPLLLSSLLLRALAFTRVTRRAPPRRKLGRPASARRAPEVIASDTPIPHSRSSADVRGMRRELADVLDAHDGSREVFRYLAHFERRFAKKGLRTLDDMSVKRLRRALAQFEAIVTNWSSSALADLRSRIAVAVARRDSGAAMWTPAPTISKAYEPPPMPMLAGSAPWRRPDFEGSRQVEVEDDVSISRFDAAVVEWALIQREALAAARPPLPLPAP